MNSEYLKSRCHESDTDIEKQISGYCGLLPCYWEFYLRQHAYGSGSVGQ
jgi:hypothetical protein